MPQEKKYWMGRTWWEALEARQGPSFPVVQDNNSDNGPWWWHNIGMSRWWPERAQNNGAEIYIYNINSNAGLYYRSSNTHQVSWHEDLIRHRNSSWHILIFSQRNSLLELENIYTLFYHLSLLRSTIQHDQQLDSRLLVSRSQNW